MSIRDQLRQWLARHDRDQHAGTATDDSSFARDRSRAGQRPGNDEAVHERLLEAQHAREAAREATPAAQAAMYDALQQQRRMSPAEREARILAIKGWKYEHGNMELSDIAQEQLAQREWDAGRGVQPREAQQPVCDQPPQQDEQAARVVRRHAQDQGHGYD